MGRPRHAQPRRLRHGASGFTLIEVMVAMILVAVIVGIGILSTQSIFEEKKLQDEMVALKLAARVAMRDAVERNRAYSITLNSNFFVIGPAYAPALIASVQEIRPENIVGKPHIFGNEVQMLVKRWSEPTFRPPGPYEQWVFEPGGICEPLSIRLYRGDDYANMHFNPLTGHSENEEIEIHR